MVARMFHCHLLPFWQVSGLPRCKRSGPYPLGSGSLDLLKQSGESLAGRISYLELGPLDLLLHWPGGELWAIEIKRSLAPTLERGFHETCADLAPVRKILIYPGLDSYPMGHDVHAMPLAQLCAELQGATRQSEPDSPFH